LYRESISRTIWKAAKGDPLPGFEAANLYHNLGLIYLRKKNYLEALNFLQKSLAMCRQQFGERHHSVATRYQSLGNTFLEMRDYARALEFHQKSLAAKEIQEQILTGHSALVEYFAGEDSIFIFVLTANQIEIIAARKDSLFEQRVSELQAGIVEQNYKKYRHAARELYRALLAPVENYLNAPNLIIVPDGLMSHIPAENSRLAAEPSPLIPPARTCS